ncbi:unnamed protein product [Rhizophagus irregularis]|uniref:Uncharacterized protein n=1 Tax=Rhizophagus irregularis TaxID=588596 RepID=A0A916E2S5_9GLOM|nr:unnamed protein product [Rhizophagus irregularis]
MSQEKHTLKDISNSLPTKKRKRTEALQELVHIRPDLKGKRVYFFPTLDKYFEEPNPASLPIASILYETDYSLYWKKSIFANIKDILLLIQNVILPGGKFSGMAVQEINEGLEFNFFERGYEDICRRLLTTNSTKIVHASKDILIKKVKKQQKFIKMQRETILNMEKYLQRKIELEEVEISDEMADVVHVIAKNVTNKKEDISNLHPIFQELIRIQTKKPNGIRYHPMFLRWAISVYSKSGSAAYNAMKMIMRLPSVSTLKNYINENEQCSGWQDKIADQILANLTVNKIWGYGRVGFFSHDSFKIQKGLLWNQRKNCYNV